MGAGHADHVHLARCDGIACGGDVRDFRRVEGGESGGRADLAGKLQVRRVAHALDRNHVGQARVRIDVPAYHVEEVHQPAVLEHVRHLQAFVGGEPAR